MKKIGNRSISIFALVLVLCLTGCAKTNTSSSDNNKKFSNPDTYVSGQLNTNPEDSERQGSILTKEDEALINELLGSLTKPSEEVIPEVEVLPDTNITSSGSGDASYSDVIDDSTLGTADNSIQIGDYVFENVPEGVIIPDDIFEQEGPCILLDPENAVFEEIPNEDYEAQVRLTNDLINLDNDSEYSFYDDNLSKSDIYSMHRFFVDHLEYLSQHTTSEEIVRELNNLYILSQTPSCMPEEAWQFYFGTLDSLKPCMYAAFYDTYYDLANFIHEEALKKSVTLKLVQEN